MKQHITFGIKTIKVFLKEKNYSYCFVLVDEHTVEHCYPLIQKMLPGHRIILIKSGEKNKNLATCSFIWEMLLESDADRNSLLINLGGGVITDLGAFAAATFKRGIDFMHIPTTLIGMADAALGGKTGFNFGELKNSVGSFTFPVLTIIEFRFLKTLPHREMVSGSAELFKHALLQGETAMEAYLKQPFLLFKNKHTENLVKDSVDFKSGVVKKDFRESDTRKQLNLGHTVGHAMESYFLSKGKKFLHGEAVALGLCAEAFLAHRFYKLTNEVFLKIIFWYDINFKKPDLKELQFETFLHLVQGDKKNSNHQIKPVILIKPGKVILNHSITTEQLKEVFHFLLVF